MGRTRILYDGVSRIRWTFSDSMDFTVCSIRCAYRAELILGRLFTYCLRKPVIKYQLIKVRLRYLNVPCTPMDSDGTFSFSIQKVAHSSGINLQVAGETRKFSQVPSLSDSMGVHGTIITVIN